jgi:general secretion pathway protein J
MTVPSRRKLASGFTLLEVLVVTFLFSLVFIFALRIVSVSLDDAGRLEDHGQRLTAQQRAITFLTMDFEQAIARPVRDAYGTEEPAMMSLPDGGVAFTRLGWANPFDLRPRSQLQRVSYVLVDGELRRYHRPLLDATTGVEEEKVVLLDGVESFTVRYLERSSTTDELEWAQFWPPDSSAQTAMLLQPLPASVEVDITLENGYSLHRYFRMVVNPWL